MIKTCLAIAFAAFLLAACAGAYVAGDVGGHHQDDSARLAPR